MPISGRGSSRIAGEFFHGVHSMSFNSGKFRRTQGGFTLIELMVVLVVMGIVLGIAAVQFMPDDHAVLREEAQRLALLLENAGMEARASGRSLAWSPEGNGYQFWSRDDYGDWARIDNDEPFRPRIFAAGVRITSVMVESQPLQPGGRLLLSSSSFTLPFQVTLGDGQAEAGVAGGSTGSVTVETEAELAAARGQPVINGHS